MQECVTSSPEVADPVKIRAVTHSYLQIHTFKVLHITGGHARFYLGGIQERKGHTEENHVLPGPHHHLPLLRLNYHRAFI